MRRLRGLVVAGAVGCATTPPEPPPPLISVRSADVGAPGAVCGARIETVRGPRPEGARVVVTVTVTADRPAPLESLEQAALVLALRRCAGGLSVLRAEAADGTDDFLSLTAEAWELVVDEAPPGPP